MLFKQFQKRKKYEDEEEDQYDEPAVIPINKPIQKRHMGISVKDLIDGKQNDIVQNDKHRNFLSTNVKSGFANYTKQKSDKPDKLMEKYIQDKIKQVIPMAYNCGQKYQEEDQMRDAELLEEIRNVQRQFLSKKDEDQSLYVGGIIEVNLSLAEKAQQLAQMEDLKRGQYLKSLIEGKPKRVQQVIIHPDEDEDKEDRQYRELKYKFYQRGRIYKYLQSKKLSGNNRAEKDGKSDSDDIPDEAELQKEQEWLEKQDQFDVEQQNQNGPKVNQQEENEGQ